jgi:hypothetical protein
MVYWILSHKPPIPIDYIHTKQYDGECLNHNVFAI